MGYEAPSYSGVIGGPAATSQRIEPLSTKALLLPAPNLANRPRWGPESCSDLTQKDF